jgi:hypothetical protein
MEDEELKFGPNGGLIFCMEYLMENMDWLQRQLSGGIGDDDEVKQSNQPLQISQPPCLSI